MYRSFIKRGMDITFSLCFILCFWWLYIVIAILIKINLGGPVLFKQERPGLNGKIFTMYKFKSMLEIKNREGKLLSDKERLTKFGRILRATSLDEIPEFYNVLIGDMSLVGPRPLLVEYLTRYNRFQFRRHNVKPGITGWAQINGRNTISWEKKFRYDVIYVKKYSFLMDLKILFLTVKKVIVREDINQGENITMEIFRGE